jgi:hypothetical protein
MTIASVLHKKAMPKILDGNKVYIIIIRSAYLASRKLAKPETDAFYESNGVILDLEHYLATSMAYIAYRECSAWDFCGN